MFFRSYTGQWLEPVAVVRSSLFNRPFLHLMCHHIRNLHGKLLAFLDGLFQLLIYLFRQTLLHDGIIEHITSKSVLHVDIISHSFSPLH